MLNAADCSFKIEGRVLLQPTSLSFTPHQFHVIMGANGAGKSTLLKLLAGSQPASSGTVSFNGKELKHYSKKELATKRAVLSQHYAITFPITVADMVMMGRYPYFITRPSAHDIDICKQSMELMEVSDLEERDYNTLSGGEAQKVQMSRVLAQIWEAKEGEEKILFLDEPVSHLDMKYQQQLLQVAADLCKRHVTIIAILHDINLSLAFASRILFMKQGKVCYEIKGRDDITPAIIKDVFDVKASIIHPDVVERPVIVF
jgi:iron complex transport system ATP-binding protein